MSFPASLVAATEYNPLSIGNCTGSRMNVEVAGGVSVLVFVIVMFPPILVTSVAMNPSMYQVMSVRGRLNPVIFTVKLSRVSVTTSTD